MVKAQVTYCNTNHNSTPGKNGGGDGEELSNYGGKRIKMVGYYRLEAKKRAKQ